MNDSATDFSERSSALQPAVPDHSARNFRVIWLMLAATFVVILNETIMSVALRELMLDLGITARSAQWLTTAFLLTMAIVIPITGFLLQRFNTRPIFITAMSLFSTGTLLAALAPNFEVLLGARVVQASGTAIMIPLLMTTIMTLVPAALRGRTMGNVSIVISVAPALGPTVSGIILNALSWRWMFWIVLPIALVMLVLGVRRVENVSEPKQVPLDVASVILSALGFGGLIYGLSRIGESGPAEASAAEQATAALPMWIALGVGILALGSFVARQIRLQRRDRALLDLRTFRSANFSVSIGVMVVSMAALFGTIILLPIYMQQVLGLEPVQTGLLLLPGGLVMGLLAPMVGRLYDRFGPKPLLIPGSVVVSAALWALAMVGESTSPFSLLGAHLVLSLGLAFLFTPLFTSALGAVQPALYAHASATVGTVQQVAGAAGTALFVTIMSTTSAALSSDGTAGIAAAAGGIRSAFLVGAIISLLAIVGAIFVSKPADVPAGVPTGH
ncbi:DHA2 family efflux MFS transporter permease subunit [Mycetocola sp.]|uniref:DHA2 family efflux MFS transporter permease subunit n=1 Tax=Mycetocola sp. TaxID=1871042 RepID=UPI0026280EF4|nr:DHA2 family efflux MFS transporter permease subunit [Mycetocola sp.]MCU1419459.1 transporter [Mycetocola sp.]MCU1560099.1 transporter [Mycetocola sp.]